MSQYELKIEKILRDCIYGEENPENVLMVHGFALRFKLDREKLELHKGEIEEFLDDILGDESLISFERLRETKDGVAWGSYFKTELLLILGRALDLLEFSNIPTSSINGIPLIIRKPKEKQQVLEKV